MQNFTDPRFTVSPRDLNDVEFVPSEGMVLCPECDGLGVARLVEGGMTATCLTCKGNGEITPERDREAEAWIPMFNPAYPDGEDDDEEYFY